MSRAFVNEDNSIEDVPDRPVSEHPNYVTPEGLTLIEGAFDAARQIYNRGASLRRPRFPGQGRARFATGAPAAPARK